jgi:hypothetical protein
MKASFMIPGETLEERAGGGRGELASLLSFGRDDARHHLIRVSLRSY